ncbi:IS5 family transposase [Candidatus Pacearchaeota archaeon]|nr:IS5 family transposase [Candidatus Pacearchaeota archaeon]
MKEESSYKKLIQRVKSGVRAARIPRSFSKKKNNVFSNEQHIVIQVLMQLEGKALRKMPAFLALVQEELHLARAVHFTKINKFALRVKQTYLETIIANMVKSNESSLVAIDGTGFSLNSRSPYFCMIAGERNRFMQANVAVEVKRRLIIAVRLRRKKRHEIIDVPYLMKQSSKQLPITAFLADKAYDCERNHELAHKCGSELIVPVRKFATVGRRVNGKYRKRLFRNFPSEIYHQRVLVESTFSAVKRRFGHLLLARKFISQKNELLFRFIAYNAEKLVNLYSIEVYFLHS